MPTSPRSPPGRATATGAELLCRGLAEAGVTHAVGLPGTQTIPLHEALQRSPLRFLHTTHELAAAFMANGYHRASGRPAALFTIPGPGFAYTLAGLAEARDDSAALVHVVGQPSRGRPHEFQAIDQRAVAGPLVKGIVTIERADQAQAGAAEAVDLACRGEPGPVMLEYAFPALVAEAEPIERRAPATTTLDLTLVGEAEAALLSARRPLLLLGQGAAGAADLARRLAEALGAPVITTASGRGVLPEDHPLALGFDHARSSVAALHELVQASDCVLAVGCKLGAAGTGIWALRLPRERLIRVDASADVLAAGYPARIAIASPAETVLSALVPSLEQVRAAAPAGWPVAEVAAWRARLRQVERPGLPESAFHGVTPPRARDFFAAMGRALPRDAIVVTDSGAHQDLARRYLEVLAPRGLIMPSDFQSMGFGLPAALGARLAAPDRPVVAVIGDGGLAMMGLELLTAVRERLPIVLVVVNDGRLNRIRLQQLITYGRTAGVDLQGPDMEAFAAAVGAGYELVDGDPEGSVRRALQATGPTLVEVQASDSGSVHLARAAGLARHARRRGRGLLARLLGRH